MEEEDIRGSKRGHDPHQPAHVTRPGTQLPQVEPGEVNTHCIKPAHIHARIYMNVHHSRRVYLPRGVGGSDEEIDHHPVTHVETVLHGPEEKPNSLVTTE